MPYTGRNVTFLSSWQTDRETSRQFNKQILVKREETVFRLGPVSIVLCSLVKTLFLVTITEIKCKS